MTNEYLKGVFNYQCDKCKSWFHGDSMIVKNPAIDDNCNLTDMFGYICHSCAISELNHRITIQGESKMKQIRKEDKKDGITVNIQIEGPMNDSVQVISPDVIAGQVVAAVKKAIGEQETPKREHVHDCTMVRNSTMNSCIIDWVEQEAKEVRKDREEASFNTKTYLDGLLRGYSNVLGFLKKRF